MKKYFSIVFASVFVLFLLVGNNLALAKTKTDPTLSITNSPVLYNGSPQEVVVTGSVAGVVSNIKYNTSSITPTDSNTYTITANFVPTDTSNYNSLVDKSAGSFIISPVSSTTTITCPTSETYTGSAITPCEATVTGIGGLSLTPTPIYTNNNNVGEATASYNFSGDSNHLGSTNSKSFNITQRKITVTATTNTKEYDGNNSASAIPTITSGTLGEGDTGNFTETYDNSSIGIDKTLTPTGIITKIGDVNVTDNYDISFIADTTGIITPIERTITASVIGGNGNILPTGSVKVVNNSGQTFNMIPITGYQVLDVVVDNISQGAISSYTFTNVIGDHNITVSFELIPTSSVIITSATGGESISSDTASLSFTPISGPILTEENVGSIGLGTIILNVPSGFEFDTSGTSANVLVTRIDGTGTDIKNINNLASGSTISVESSSNQLIINITSKTQGNVKNSLTWQNIRVRPTAGTPLATGNITKTGTSTYTGDITNYGTLNEIIGNIHHIVINPIGPQNVATGLTLNFSAMGYDVSDNVIPSLTYDWAVEPGTGTGSIDSAGVLTAGNVGTVTATATSGGKTGTSGIITITTEPIVTHTLTYVAGAHGSISETTPQTVNDGTNGTSVTAIADSGYHFVSWSDESTSNPRTDMNVTNNINVTANFAIDSPTEDTIAPVITLNGSPIVTTILGSSYNDQGATALDNIDGNITSKIITVNDINTSIVGTYTITYNVIDNAGNHATEVKRTVNVIQWVTSSHGGGGYLPGYGPSGSSTTSATNTTSGGQVLGSSKFFFTENMHIGSRGNEVTQIQIFLNARGFNCGEVDGTYGMKTMLAVVKFQVTYNLKADGIVGPLTRAILNML